MSFTPFNAPILSGLLGDAEIVSHFSVQTELKAMLQFEVALAEAQGKSGVIPGEAAAAIANAASAFEPDIKSLQAGTARDGVVVPEFVRQLREQVGKANAKYVHFAITSQDVIDTALMIRLSAAMSIFETRIENLVRDLGELDQKFGDDPMMGRTRMQAALEITVRHRLNQWRAPLEGVNHRLKEVVTPSLCVSFGGPVGDGRGMNDHVPAVASHMAKKLGLADQTSNWHSNRQRIVEIANWCSNLTGALGKMGQDVSLMAQNGINEIKLSKAGGSSAMPHKQNPVLAETLVTLARFNATLVSGIHHSLVHEQERSGSAWALEWMLLPQMVVATGAATLRASDLVSSVLHMGNSR